MFEWILVCNSWIFSCTDLSYHKKKCLQILFVEVCECNHQQDSLANIFTHHQVLFLSWCAHWCLVLLVLLPFAQLTNLKTHVKKTNLDPLLHDMRWAIVELMTFLVVAAFKPNKTLLRPSPKLGSDVVWSQPMVWFSSSRCLILFITARPICSWFLLSSSCVDLLVYKVL